MKHGFKKGHTTWNKGIPMSLESRRKMSEAKKGKPGNHRGMSHSEVTKLRISQAKKGRVSNRHGHTHTAEARAKMSASHTGLRRSEETKRKIGIASTGRKHTEETKKKMSEIRIKYLQSPCRMEYMHDTKPELKMKAILDSLGVHYLCQQQIDRYVVDFFVPNKNLIIEVDGIYWHSLPGRQEKDKARDEHLTSMGYKVVRFWEHELDAIKITQYV